MGGLKNFYLKFFLKSYFKARKKKILLNSVHRSASTLPIFNWWGIHEGKIRLIFKEPRGPKPDEIELLDEVWSGIVSEFIDEVGIGKEYAKIMTLENKLEILRYKYASTHNKRLKLDISILEDQLHSLINNEKVSVSKYKEMGYLNKEGFIFDEHKISVLRYYGYVKILEDKIAANKKNNGK